MKDTGCVRHIDELGRIVLPIEVRRILNLSEKSPMKIFVGNDNEVILKKIAINCIMCGSIDNLKSVEINTLPSDKTKTIHICQTCLERIESIIKE